MWLRARRLRSMSSKHEITTSTDNRNRSWNNARLQLISDCADICLPATSLGYFNLDDGAVGLAGITSSLIGLYKAWEGVRV